MRINKKLIMLIPGVVITAGSPRIQAATFGLEYDTELQTDFRGGFNWANLLRLSASVPVSSHFSFEGATISIAKTNPDPLIDDLQGFSNIDEDNRLLAIAVLGAEYRNRRSTFFIGIRNVNEDYFTSPVTSLFVNSSCGIFPTIAGNYDIANYPLSSWCLHYKAEWDRVVLQTSLYDGLGHRRIAGHDHVFEFAPRRDGLFSITSAEYMDNGSNYSLGLAVHYGMHPRDEIFNETEKPETDPAASKSFSFAPWVNIEQRLSDECSVMFQASAAAPSADCRYYLGVGSAYSVGKCQFGIFANYAKYRECSETAAELTCRIELSPIVSVQPAFEVIRSGGNLYTVGIARLSISI